MLDVKRNEQIMKEDKEYKKHYNKYAKCRNKLYKLVDKFGMEASLPALSDTLTDILEDEAVDLVKESLANDKENKAAEELDGEDNIAYNQNGGELDMKEDILKMINEITGCTEEEANQVFNLVINSKL